MSSFIPRKSRSSSYFRFAAVFGFGVGVGFGMATFFWSRKRQRLRVEPAHDVPTITHSQRSEVAVHSDLLRFGHPGPVVDTLARQFYVAAYNRAFKQPHWVLEHLRRNETLNDSSENSINVEEHHSTRQDNSLENVPVDRNKFYFKEDQDIPKLYRARLADYFKSGYDRGHLVPFFDAAESGSGDEACEETFLLTNISPQHPKLNRIHWMHLEVFVRHLLKSTNDTMNTQGDDKINANPNSVEFKDLYVLTGPLFLPKISESKSNADEHTLVVKVLKGMIPVPTHFFKSILAIDHDDKLYLQTFVLPNEDIKTPSKQVSEYVVPEESIERATGLQLWSKVDRTRVKKLCSVVDCTVKSFLDLVSGNGNGNAGRSAADQRRPKSRSS